MGKHQVVADSSITCYLFRDANVGKSALKRAVHLAPQNDDGPFPSRRAGIGRSRYITFILGQCRSIQVRRLASSVSLVSTNSTSR